MRSFKNEMKRKKEFLLGARFRATSDFQRGAERIGFNGSIHPRADLKLRVGGFRANLQIGISQRAADGINTNQMTGAQKIDTEKIA